MLAPGLELRLDQDDGLGQRGRRSQNGGEHERSRDKRDVHDEQRFSLALVRLLERAGLEQTRVGAFQQAYTRIVAQPEVDLPEAGVDGCDQRGAVLQQAVSESAGGGAYIEAGTACDLNLPVLQRRHQLQSAAADVRLVLAQQAKSGIGRNRRSRLVDLLFPHQNPSGKDERASTFAAGGKAPRDEQQVDSRFPRPRFPRQRFFGARFFRVRIFVRRGHVKAPLALNVQGTAAAARDSAGTRSMCRCGGSIRCLRRRVACAQEPEKRPSSWECRAHGSQCMLCLLAALKKVVSIFSTSMPQWDICG
jgi:hypothetical protein